MFFGLRVDFIAGYGRAGQVLVCGINCIYRQKLLTGVGAGIDPAAMTRDVDQGGRSLFVRSASAVSPCRMAAWVALLSIRVITFSGGIRSGSG